jgi:hypothetical protein
MVGITLTTPITQFGVSFGFATPAEETGINTEQLLPSKTVRMALWPNEAAFGAYVAGGGTTSIGGIRKAAPVLDVQLPGDYLCVAFGLALPDGVTAPTLPSPPPFPILAILMWILTTAPSLIMWNGTVVTL